METECGRLALSSSSIPAVDSNRLSQLTVAESHINLAVVVTWKARGICDPDNIFIGTQAQRYTELRRGKKGWIDHTSAEGTLVPRKFQTA